MISRPRDLRALLVVSLLALAACSGSSDGPRARTTAGKRHKPGKAGHGKHPHEHGAHPHGPGAHHHHDHPHPHLEGASGHHHPF